MLSNILRRTVLRQNARLAVQNQMRFYRPGTQNIYKVDPTPIFEAEKKDQENLPVWDRIFDHGKYMQHEGPLKVSIP